MLENPFVPPMEQKRAECCHEPTVCRAHIEAEAMLESLERCIRYIAVEPPTSGSASALWFSEVEALVRKLRRKDL